MLRSDVIILVADPVPARGVYETPESPAHHTVFVTVDGVGLTELYTAMASGFRPEVKFHLAMAEDYDREREVIWRGERYGVIRAQIDRDGGDGVTLVCQRGVQKGEAAHGSD